MYVGEFLLSMKNCICMGTKANVHSIDSGIKFETKKGRAT
jgi:hypothetical protein